MSRTHILTVAALLFMAGCNYSEGERAGVVSKISRKGYLCKSWEGELSMLGVQSVTQSGLAVAASSNTFAFSVLDDSIVQKIKTKLDSGERATLQYEQKIIPPFCWRETEYVIVGVR